MKATSLKNLITNINLHLWCLYKFDWFGRIFNFNLKTFHLLFFSLVTQSRKLTLAFFYRFSTHQKKKKSNIILYFTNWMFKFFKLLCRFHVDFYSVVSTFRNSVFWYRQRKEQTIKRTRKFFHINCKES